MRIRELILISVPLTLLLAAPAGAYTISLLGTDAGGNPGDLCGTLGGTTCQPYYEVSGLVADDSFDMTWELDGSEITGPDLIPDFPILAASANLSVVSITSTTVVLNIILNNDVNADLNPVGFEASLISIGMKLGGFDSGVLTSAGTYLDTYDTGNVAGGPGLTGDFCASTNAACNTGNEADGIVIGGTDTLQFTLTGAFNTTTGLTLANFAVKWQTNYDDLNPDPDDPFVVDGNSSFEQPGLPGTPIPEPSTALLTTLGLLGLSWVGRSRR